MSSAIYWFRNDLRLGDNPGLRTVAQKVDELLPVYCHPASGERSRWDFPRVDGHRQRFLRSALDGLQAGLRQHHSTLVELEGSAADVLSELALDSGIKQIVCESIAAPEEIAAVGVLRSRGFDVRCRWQSTLFDQNQLPFAVDQMPEQYTRFRVALEGAGTAPAEPVEEPGRLPSPPAHSVIALTKDTAAAAVSDPRSAFPYQRDQFSGSEAAATAHLQRYFSGDLAAHYKDTRNQLIGSDYSTKFSPWLALGALSVRQVYTALQAFEQTHGRSDGSYWIWFELLWREQFRWMYRKHGRRLYWARGLRPQAEPLRHHPERFADWCAGQTGHAFVDAGMRELKATGYLSNRMRQVVASYLIHELDCDYRAGAAWFESQLIDYDVYSNQGNWLYLAGRGTDPRGGRQFNPDKQARHYDPDGRYRELWSHV